MRSIGVIISKVSGSSDEKSYGTGFLIDDLKIRNENYGFILTVAHNFLTYKSFNKEFQEKKRAVFQLPVRNKEVTWQTYQSKFLR